MMPNNVIGLTGGIASGKSTMTEYLRVLGYQVVDADAIAKGVLGKGTEGLDQVVNTFGPEVLQSDGSLNRRVLREIIFSDENHRKALEAITHPLIKKEIFNAINEAMLVSNAFIFVDIPLLFETHYDQYFRNNVVIDVDIDVQRARLLARDGVSEELANQMIGAQMPLEEKKKLASHLVENKGSITDFKQNIDRLINTLKQ